MAQPNSKLAFSIREACAATSLGRTTIYALIANHQLSVVRVGGRTLIPADSLHALVSADPSAGSVHLGEVGDQP
jgi:excisionase family DNA binding protein